MFKTRLTELLGIRYPIIQGGLAHLAFAELCAAVSNAGALGQITASSMRGPDEVRQEIRRVRSLTDAPFAVNFAISEHRDIPSLLEVALEEAVPAVTFTAGNPERFIQRVREVRPETRVLVLTAGVRQAQKAEQLGADAVIAVGFDGGGHIGRDDIGTMVLVPRVVDSVKIPVVASGGIGDGRGLMAALALGAEGIEMGTRFVATRECIAHDAYKQALVQARETDTTIITRSLGMPGRVLKGPFPDRILQEEARGATIEELLPLIGGERNKRAALEGHMDEGYVWAGQVVGLIHDIPPAQELIERIMAEAKAIADRLCRYSGPP